jgi:hypothetical protein
VTRQARLARSLRDKVRVEALDEERVANLERRIVARAAEAGAARESGSRRGLALAGFAAALAASAAIGWKLHNEAPVVAGSDTKLAVTTGAEHSTLALDDATIDSAPNTRLAITQGAHRIVIAMTDGRVELDVAHRDDRVVLVRAGDTEIEDVGTRFTVEYAGANAGGRVAVHVAEGEVKVTRAGKSVRVAAGAGWSTEPEAVATNAMDDHPSSGADVASDGRAPAAAPAPAPVVVADTTIALRDHHAAAPVELARMPSPMRNSSPIATASRTAPASTSTGTGRLAMASDPYVDLKLAIKRQAVEFDPNIDGVGDAAGEIARLKKIAYSPTTLGADASKALYRIAVLLHKPLKHDVEALRTLDVYRRRFAGGNEMHAAAWLRVRIACEHAIDDECRKAAYAYQHDVPVGSATEVAVRITNAQ